MGIWSRGAWHAAVRKLQRVGCNLETEQQQQIIMSEEKNCRNYTKVPRV